MKQGAEIADKIKETDNKKEIKQLQHIFSMATTTGINYASMMHSLEKCQRHSESSTGAKYTKKNTKILDRHKLICRILTHTYRTTPHYSKQENILNVLSSMATRIRKGITDSQTLANTHSSQLHPPLVNTNSTIPNIQIIEINDSQSQQDITDLQNSPVSATSNSTIKRLQAEILMERNYISDEAITTAIEVLRQDMEQHNVYIAHGLANINILDWGPTQGWERFSRIFNSRNATFTKPNGLYIIPVFESGHWFIAAIRKHNRLNQGWLLDSLRDRQPEGNICNRIQEAFV